MQKFVTKKLLFTLSGACLLAWWIIYAAGPQIIIDPTRFVSQQRIQRININSTGNNTVKEALLNSWTNKPVLLIGSTSGSDNLWAVTRNNTITWDVSSVVWWKGNSNLWNETSLIAWSQDSIITKNTKSTVILWWNNNTWSSTNQVILSSEKTKVSKTNAVAMWLSNSNIDSSYAIGLIWDKITISWGSNSVALWSNINIQTWWMFIFNANGGTVNWNLKDTVFINAQHWLVIWGPKIIPSTVSNSHSVKLTVHGWVALWQGMCSKDTIGGIYYASGTTKTNGKISCICACVASGSTAKSIAVSNQPYCDVACKNTEGAWGNEKIDGSAVCGSRGYAWSWSKISQEHWKEMIYEAWETTWRPNSDFCKDWSTPNVGTLESNAPGVVDFPWTGMTVSWVCPWLTDKDPKVQCNAYKKVVPPKCWENAKKYYLNDEAYPTYAEVTFCEIGEFFWISSPSKTYSDYDFPEAWSTITWWCKTNSWHVDAIENKSCVAERGDCNHCAKNGFPYCFDIDYTTVSWKPGCESYPDETEGVGWEEPVQKVVVSFNTDGWAFIQPAIIDKWSKISEYGAPARWDGWPFMWWYSDAAYTTKNNWDAPIYENKTIYARFCHLDTHNYNPSTQACTQKPSTYTVQFNCNGWSNPPANQTFTVGKSQALSANTCTRTNYKFLWWSKTSWWSKEYNDGASVDLWGTAWSTIKLYAVWQLQEQTYTVQFNCNGWSNPPANQTFTVGKSQALSANTCTRTNYKFLWWSKTSWWSKEYNDGASVDLWGTAWSTVKLYAVWQSQEQTYTVQFDCNGWSGTPPASQTFTVGQAGKLNANTCTRTSPWSFKWWSKTKWWSKDYDNQATVDLWWTANSTITLYAVWQRTITPASCPNGCFYAAAVDQCFKNSCFIAWTKVRMADWSEKNIEDISEWEMVLWANWEYNTVQWLHMPKLWSKKLWSINGWKNFFTEEHPFMTTEWWKAINSELAMQEIDLEVWELQVWDVLVTNNGYVVIRSLEWVEWDKDTQLYNLMLDWDHTYYADDYLVHNKLKMLAYLDGGECPSGTELRWAWCCPSNTWWKGSECVPLCDEGLDPDPDPTPTVTYSWTCVSDSDNGYCVSDNVDKWWCSSVDAAGLCETKQSQYSCHGLYYAPVTNWSAIEHVVWATWPGDPDNWICPHWDRSCIKWNTTYYRCCTWATSVVKCKSSNWNIVSDSYCSWKKPDCSKLYDQSLHWTI